MEIYFFGDSLTQASPGCNFVKMVKNSFADKKVKVYNKGLGGDTIVNLFERIKKMKMFKRQIEKEEDKYDIFFVLVGVNDILGMTGDNFKRIKKYMKTKDTPDVEEFVEKYEEMIIFLEKYTKNLVIFPSFLIGEEIENKWNNILDQQSKGVEDLITKRNKEKIENGKRVISTFVDLRKEITNKLKEKESISKFLPTSLMTMITDVYFVSWFGDNAITKKSKERNLHLTLDGVHLNYEGAKLISDLAIKEIQRILNK